MTKRVTIPEVIRAKSEGRKLTMLTAYDHLTAKLLDEAGIDMLLVGDTLGMIIQGEDSTLPVTMDESVYHTKIVTKSSRRAMVVGDMPFGSYQISIKDAVTNAIRLIKEGGAQAVKLEGGARVLNQVRAIVNAEIPVMGHLGLTPQSVHKFGGHKVQARSEYAVQRLISDALALEEAGVFAVVLEAVPVEAARRVTEVLKVPT
jgi:3-methyl-2-oxobutanoate hydroxymethyltransferase